MLQVLGGGLDIFTKVLLKVLLKSSDSCLFIFGIFNLQSIISKFLYLICFAQGDTGIQGIKGVKGAEVSLHVLNMFFLFDIFSPTSVFSILNYLFLQGEKGVKGLNGRVSFSLNF